MYKNVILARMGEVTLKGLNRGKFEIQLKSNLKYRLRKKKAMNMRSRASLLRTRPASIRTPRSSTASMYRMTQQVSAASL